MKIIHTLKVLVLQYTGENKAQVSHGALEPAPGCSTAPPTGSTLHNITTPQDTGRVQYPAISASHLEKKLSAFEILYLFKFSQSLLQI